MASVMETIKVASSVISGIDATDSRLALLELVEKTRLLLDENQDLRRKNERLVEQLVRKKAWERIGATYYLMERDGTKTGPVCPVCYERDGIPRILRSTEEGAECASCGEQYPGVEASVKSRGCEVW